MAFEKRISQIKDHIEKKLVNEERVVLQQERVEMLERVCKQVQGEESHILDSLRRELKERIEKNIREEAQALLAKRRKEIANEVEAEVRAEKIRLVENRSRERSDESEHLNSDRRAGLEVEDAWASSLEATDTSRKQHSRNEMDDPISYPMSAKSREQDEANCLEIPNSLSKKSDPMSAKPREQDEVECSETPKVLPKKPITQREEACLQIMHNHARKPPRLHKDQDEEGEWEGEKGKAMKDSSQRIDAEERKFEKSFHTQDSQANLMIKLEVSLKVGASND